MTVQCPSAALPGETNTREERAGLSLTAQGDRGRVGVSRKGGAQDTVHDRHTLCMYATVSLVRDCCMKTSLQWEHAHVCEAGGKGWDAGVGWGEGVGCWCGVGCACVCTWHVYLSVVLAVESRATSEGENPANLNTENPPTPSIMERCT